MTDLPRTMLAAVLHGRRDLRLEERPVPTPGAGEVLVRVGVVGVCGSDLHFYEDGRAGSSIVDRPFVPGHEFGGTIVAVGGGTDHRVGERVSVEPGIACGACGPCRRGHGNHCAAVSFLGAAPVDGALQEYVAVPSRVAHPVPDEVSDRAAALAEPLSVAIWAVGRAEIGPEASVLVVGAGPIGYLTAIVARLRGADVTVVEPNEDRRARVAEIEGVRGAHPEDLVAGDERFTVTLECSGTRSGLATAIGRIEEAGRIVVVGVGVESLELDLNLLQEQEVSLTGSHRYQDTWPEAIALLSGPLGDLDRIVERVLPLASAEAAITAARTDPSALKTAIQVGPTRPAGSLRAG